MEQLLAIDQALFVQLNGHWTHPVLDFVMPLITDFHREPLIVYGLLPVVLTFWLFRQKLRAAKVILATVAAVAISDGVSYRLIKPHINRDRPEFSGVPVALRTQRHSGKSFPSNHAANNFAAAIVLSLALPGLGWVFFPFAALIAYSRVYVGVHYPMDVLGGAIIGLLAGWCVWLVLRKFIKSDVDSAHERS